MVTISAVNGNTQKLDGGAMFGNAPRAMWEKWIAPDKIGRIDLACRCFLVEFDHYKILLEAGIGNFFEPKLAARFGVQNPERHILIEELKKLGVSAEDITHVILSHLHFDHAGGILPPYDQIQAGNNGLIFKNAEYWVGEKAWHRALNPHPRDRASFISDLPEKMKATGKLKIIEEQKLEENFSGRLSFFESEGHTPGQKLCIIKGDNEQIVFCGDLVPGSHWVHIPISMGYDRFPEKVIDEKRDFYESLALDKTYFCFTHDEKIAAAKLEQNEKGRYMVKEPIENPVRKSF